MLPLVSNNQYVVGNILKLINYFNINFTWRLTNVFPGFGPYVFNDMQKANAMQIISQ